MVMINKILLAMDGSDQSKHALDYAVEISKKWSSKLLILSVVPPVFVPVIEPGLVSENIERLKEETKKYYQKVLIQAEEKLNKHPDFQYKTVLEYGKPCKVINEVASNENVDLIVIGSRGLGGITGYLLGSTSHRVADHCKMPILIVK
jgi:nucleotide-binding universal stress UspA family protein